MVQQWSWKSHIGDAESVMMQVANLDGFAGSARLEKPSPLVCVRPRSSDLAAAIHEHRDVGSVNIGAHFTTIHILVLFPFLIFYSAS